MAVKSRLPRVVLDTNVVVAAIRSHNPHSPTVELLRLWAQREFILLYSDDVYAEYVAKLSELTTTSSMREMFLAAVIRRADHIIVRDKQVLAVTADHDDDAVLACAVVGKATHLITYDPHLTAIGPLYRKVNIISALEFLKQLRLGD